jgi:TonB-linked SusC/RagA family outer membrane protein
MKTKFTMILTLFMAFVVQLTFAQQRTISGTVSDENGLPLLGATVVISGSSTGTTTDFDGNYKINANTGNVLIFSYVGYQGQNISVGASNTVNVTLQLDNTLDEVVVTALGIKSNPRSLSYSVQSVDSEDITKSRETNLVSALNAKAAGVQVVTSSGSVGASANIRIRGNTSITRSNGPLFVVDGVPIDNSSFSEDATQSSNNSSLSGSDFSNRAIDINSNDIESVNVLKGISAQTLYGLRAANGVILITTKKGRSGKTKVTLNTTTTFSEYNKGPDLQRTYAQGRHASDGSGFEYRGPETFEGDSWGPAISDLEYDGDTTYPFDRGGRLVAAGTGNGIAARSYNPYDFFITGVVNDLNISASGGTDKVRYRGSIGRLTQSGISPNEEFERKTFRADITAKMNEKLTLDMSGQYTNSGGDRVQRGSNISGIMLGLLRTAPTFDNGNGLTGQAAADNASSYFYDIAGSELPGQRSYRDGIYNNPYFTVAKNKNKDDVNRLLGKMGLSYNLTDWLELKTTASVDRYTDTRKIGFDIIDASFGNGRFINDDISNQDVNWNFLAIGNHTFNDKLGVSFTVGYDGFYTKSNRRTVIGDGMAIPGFFHLTNVSSIQAQELTGAKKLIGAFATATLSYDNMIFVTPSLRNDWSSTLPVDNNTFQSFSLGGSFVFSELLKDNDILNYGKLRGSWGKSGNDAPVYATTTNFNGSSAGGDGFIQSVNFPAYDQISFERSSRAGNPNLKPEETTEFEVGLELALLDRRLKFDIAYYDKETKDQIIFVDAAPSSGFIDRYDNVGVVSNTGVEIALSGSPIITDNFEWNVAVNWTTFENKVEELADGVEFVTLNGFSSTRSVAIAGESYGSIYGSRFLRNESGQVLIGDDGYPLNDPKDGVVGDPTPDWTAGISNTFNYKNFGLSVLLDIRQGGDVWCGTCGIIDYFGVSKATLIRNQSTVFNGIVRSTNAVNTKSVPYSDPTVSENNNYWRRYGFGGLSETAVYDSSWVRLREVTFSYNFPDKLLNKTFIERLSLSIYGRNLWLNTDYPGIDPETNLTGDSNGIGLDYFNQPNTKSYGISLNVSF